MSTHAIIGISDGINIRATYVHFDGYVSHTGFILNDHYNKPDKINKLIDLGELSAIGTDTDHCQAYGRDRGETGTEPKNFLSLADFVDFGNSYFATFNYLYEDDRWVVNKIGTNVWVPLKMAIDSDIFP
jgi:hypothetical protein